MFLLYLASRVVTLLSHVADGARLDRLHTLRRMADELRCYVVLDIGGGANYCAVNAGPWTGAIRLDVLQAEADIVRDLAHELTHHVLRQGLVHTPHGDAPAEEAICRMVAEIIRAVPAGLQWNGKLPLPKGDGTIRIYEPLNVSVLSQSIPPDEWPDGEE